MQSIKVLMLFPPLRQEEQSSPCCPSVEWIMWSAWGKACPQSVVQDIPGRNTRLSRHCPHHWTGQLQQGQEPATVPSAPQGLHKKGRQWWVMPSVLICFYFLWCLLAWEPIRMKLNWKTSHFKMSLGGWVLYFTLYSTLLYQSFWNIYSPHTHFLFE